MGQKILHAIGLEPKSATVMPWKNVSKLVAISNGRKKANENEKLMETSKALILRDDTFQNKKRGNTNVISNSRKSFDHRKFVQKQTASVAPKFGIFKTHSSSYLKKGGGNQKGGERKGVGINQNQRSNKVLINA